jgi:arginase family enzyme
MDLEDDVTAGFDLISTWDLDEHGVDWITKKIKQRVGTGPVVISLDVDVMDPSMVPASMSFQPSPRSSISYLVLRTLEFGPS